MKINNTNIDLVKLHTEIFGLLYEPKMINFSNTDDWSVFTKRCSVEVSSRSYDLVSVLSKQYMQNGIMEIGVSRNGDGSFTNAILKNKPDHIPYLGIDVEDKSYLNNYNKNIFTLQIDSANQNTVRKKLKKINMQNISLLFIDGNHSVDYVINDWKYTDLLSNDGAVFLHDTNTHAGPTLIVEAIDRNIFDVTKYFENDDDYGLTIAKKI